MTSTPTVDGERFMQRAQSENDFMLQVRSLAAMAGWLDYHTHIAKRSSEGWPDLAMIRRGVMVYAELKKELPLLKRKAISENQDYYPTRAQQRWLDELNIHSAAVALQCCRTEDGTDHPIARMEERLVQVYLWRPSDWPQIERVLR